MKLPIDFGTKLFFRVLAPGIITAALFSRLSYFFLVVHSLEQYWPYVFTVSAVTIGCLYVACDMPIYMLFEGRRYVPAWVRLGLRGMEEQRLSDLLRDAEEPVLPSYIKTGTPEFQAERRRIKLEAQLEVSFFPTNAKTGAPEVQCPTRLGNLIYSYETYSDVKYGMDAVFYWPRIWVKLDKDLREEIDNHQALADGLLYTTFGLVLAGIASAISAPFDLLFPNAMSFAWIWPVDLLLGAALLVTAYVIYRASLFVHASFGSLFCATIDQYRDKVRDLAAEKIVASLSGVPDLSELDEISRNRAVFRYLRWHRIKRAGQRSERVARGDP